jgi:hypothetical protein
VAIPCIDFISDFDESGFPFKLIQNLFPVNMALSLTNIKFQCQTVGNLGIPILDPVFSNGQLYFVFSQ